MKICPVCRNIFNTTAGFCPNDGQPLVMQMNPAAHSQTQPTVGDQSFSASLAMTFFGQHFVEKMTDGNGLEPPCQTNTRINPTHFYYEVLIIPFWFLLENNFIRFQPGLKPTLLSGEYSTLHIQANHSQQGSFPGLEYDFWEIIKYMPPGVTVEEVVAQFFGSKTNQPEDMLNRRLIDWMTQLGYGRPDDTKPFFRFGDDGDRRIFEFFPDCQRIAAQEQKAQIIQSGWLKFLAEQSQVYHHLFEDVVRAATGRANPNTKMLRSSYWKAKEHYLARFSR